MDKPYKAVCGCQNQFAGDQGATTKVCSGTIAMSVDKSNYPWELVQFRNVSGHHISLHVLRFC